MNSFETLGLLPSFLEGIGRDEIVTISKQMYKALQFVYHPDKRADGMLKSEAITEAYRTIESDYDFENERKDYLENGPGQREINSGRHQLESLMQNTGMMDKKIKDTRAVAENIKKRDLSEPQVWLRDFYGYGTADFIDDEGGFADGLFIRSTPGKRVVVVDPGIINEEEDLEMEILKMRESYVKRNEDVWKPNLKQFRINLDLTEISIAENENPESPEYRKLTEKEVEKYKKDIEKIKQEIKKIEKERGSLRAEIESKERKKKNLRKKRRFEVKIDKDGYVIEPGEKKQGRLLGSSESELHYDGFHSMVERGTLEPGIGPGRLLVSMDKEGTVKIHGIIQKIKNMPARKKKQRKEIAGKKEEEPEVVSDVLGKKEEIKVHYKKNPFESIGLLPSLVANLNEEELRHVVRVLGKGLKMAFHPDTGKGNAERLMEVKSALSELEDPAVFSESKSEYEKSPAGESMKKALFEELDRKRKEIGEKAKELAQAKAEEERQVREIEKESNKTKEIINDIFSDIYRQEPAPARNPGAVYLHQAKGCSITLDGGETYTIENKGFDVFAVSGRKRINLMGCVREELSREEAKEMLDKDKYDAVQPILYEKGLLVSIDKKIIGSITGMNTVSEQMKKDAKRATRKISEQIKQPKKKSKRKI